MCAHIQFPPTDNRKGGIRIHKIHSCSINTSWQLLTDTAEITLPRNVSFFDKQRVRDIFRRGDPVIIELGYNSDLQEEFAGYITEISADIPIKLKCQDEMWRLKQLPVNVSKRSTTLKELLAAICPRYNINAIEVGLGGVRFSNTTVSAVLDRLKQDFGLNSYMKGKTLVCGNIYVDDSALKPVKFHLEKSIVNNVLNYRRAEDVLIKIRAISTLPNGKKLEVEMGDAAGELRQLSYYNIELTAELKKLAELDYKKYKRDGFDGSFTAFGVPSVRHGMKAVLESQLYPERTGTYYIDSVVKTMSKSGYRQEIKLGDSI